MAKLAEQNVTSWGGYSANVSSIITPQWRNELVLPQGAFLACGQRRSYGDSCVLSNASLIDTSQMNHFIDFDEEKGVLHVEAGVLIKDILDCFVARGYFLPVVPGTQYVSIGGAIANDVHGKNHHKMGSFGQHVEELTLRRSDGSLLTCSGISNEKLFYSTIAGLGLTGVIVSAKVRLIRIPSAFLRVDHVPFSTLADFIYLSKASEDDYDYHVAWFDCMAKKNVRGIFTRANFDDQAHIMPIKTKQKEMPFYWPQWALNHSAVRLFNQAYYFLQKRKGVSVQTPYTSFFFPLDGLGHWNRIYGKAGFYQFQCLLPWVNAELALKSLLSIIAKSKQGSFLAVLKTCGSGFVQSPLSFPASGVTLALDFANHAKSTRNLLQSLYDVVQAANGRIYPAKDRVMSSALFAQAYPQWQHMLSVKDPNISSDFWRRVAQV